MKDGEGMTRFVTLKVKGAIDDEQADVAARAVANSFLVKTGWAGTYPVWGRIIDVLGYCKATIEPNAVDMWYNDLAVVYTCDCTEEYVRINMF